jgi:hypothetical protein
MYYSLCIFNISFYTGNCLVFVMHLFLYNSREFENIYENMKIQRVDENIFHCVIISTIVRAGSSESCSDRLKKKKLKE